MKFATRFLVVAACLLLPLSSAAATTAKPARGLKIINVMPAFLAFEARAGHDMSPAARVALFRKLVIAPYSNIYGEPEFKHDITDEGIEHYLTWVEPYLPLMRELSHQVNAGVQPALKRFLDAFPDFDGSKLTVVFMPSLNQFVGQSGKLVNGDQAMLFGLDRMAKYHDRGVDPPVVFTHELFHVYHQQINPVVFQKPPPYAELLIEGLATYVSQRLNPGTSDATALLDPKLAAASPQLVSEAARQFLAEFASTAPAAHDKFFYSGYKGKLPPLTGYLLGYKACEQLGKKYSMKQMARLGGKQLESMLHLELAALAKASPSSDDRANVSHRHSGSKSSIRRSDRGNVDDRKNPLTRHPGTHLNLNLVQVCGEKFGKGGLAVGFERTNVPGEVS